MCRLQIQEITRRKEEIRENALQFKNPYKGLSSDFNEMIQTFNAVVQAKRQNTKIEAWKTKLIYLREVFAKNEPLSVDQEAVTRVLDIFEGSNVTVKVEAFESLVMEWFDNEL